MNIYISIDDCTAKEAVDFLSAVEVHKPHTITLDGNGVKVEPYEEEGDKE